ncbi:MAG TPA: hypothetical protein VFX98_00890 [Longimicrobiaceae bacterium]|nr:hypothetical protein [Longimicrobiaceae bacterium]
MTVAAVGLLLGACGQDAGDTLFSPTKPRFDGHTPGGNVVSPPDSSQTTNEGEGGTTTLSEPVQEDSTERGHTPGGN